MQRIGRKLRAIVARVKRRLCLLLGLAAVLPLVAVDPDLVVLVFDAELLALLGSVGLGLVRADVRVFLTGAVGALATSLPVLEIRAGWRLTREEPRSLLTA